MSYDRKDNVVLVYSASFIVWKQAGKGKEQKDPHQDVGDREEAKISGDASEGNGEGSDADSTVSAAVYCWKLSVLPFLKICLYLASSDKLK